MIHILNRTRAINYNELDKSNSIQSDISNQSDISSKTPLFKHKLFNNKSNSTKSFPIQGIALNKFVITVAKF